MSGRVPPGGERAIYPVHAMPHKRGRQICLLRSKVHHLCQPRRSSGVQAEVPKLEPQIEFSVGIFSHKRVKHLNFTVRRSGAILPRNPPRTFHQQLLFCSVPSPAPSVLAARELTIRTARLVFAVWKLCDRSSSLCLHPGISCASPMNWGTPGSPSGRGRWCPSATAST